MKKATTCLTFCMLFAFLLCPVCASAEGAADLETEAAAVAEEWREWQNAIPPEVAALLPEGFFSERIEEVEASVAEAGATATVLAVIGRMTGMTVGENLSLLAGICGILVLSAVLRALVKNGETASAIGSALSFCATLSLCLAVFSLMRARFTALASYFAVMKDLGGAMLPLMGALYAMGGNVSSAVANHGVMSVFLSLLEMGLGGTVIPVASICLVLGLLDAVSGQLSLRPLSGLIKRTYTLCFSFLMLLLCGVLGIQTTLAKGSDTLALRTMRFAAGSFLPVVGGSVSEALRTVMGSVQYLRGVVGVGGVLVILYAFLPVFLPVLLNRITLLLCGAAAKLLGCDGEERLLSELASVFGYFMAVIASVFVLMIFSLTLFARCAAAGG